MNVMLLAAGQGTRLRPYTEVIPKPAIPFLNVPLAAYSLYFIKSLDIDKLVVNTFHLPEKVHQLFNELPISKKIQINFSDETGFIRGSGGGLKSAEKHFTSEHILLLNSDEVTIPKDENIVAKAAEFHKKSNSLATLLVTENPEVGSKFGGVWVDANNNVLGFGKTPTPGSIKGYHFIGAQFLDRKVLSYIPENQENNILYDAVTKGLSQGDKVSVFPIECTWYETGNPHDFFSAQSDCLQAILEKNHNGMYLEKVVETYATEKVQYYQKGNAYIAKSDSAQIDESSSLSGTICIGKNAHIKANAKIENSAICANVIVPENSNLSNTIVLS